MSKIDDWLDKEWVFLASSIFSFTRTNSQQAKLQRFVFFGTSVSLSAKTFSLPPGPNVFVFSPLWWESVWVFLLWR